MVDRNPFEYEAANNLPSDKIASYYIDDFNYSRFINSTRNVVMVGDRGCGKTMALIYNSIEVQGKIDSNTVPDRVGIYVPCKTVLMQKREQELLKDPQYSSIISEHILTVSVLFHLVNDISKIPVLAGGVNNSRFREEISYSLGFDVPEEVELLEGLRQCINKEAREVQSALNAPKSDADFPETRSFGTSVLPLLDCMRRRLPELEHCHFMIMLDDVHDLSKEQLSTINSWIAYRDHSLFSIKIASARSEQLHYKTSTGGSIIDGHDFVQIDLEQPYHNEESNFGQLAKKLVERRLEDAGINASPEKFFPTDKKFLQEIEACREVVRKHAIERFPDGPDKTINDYVYRFTRAEWFRKRASHANLPAYSGFQTLVYLSTGVIRNLLEPCYWMYDDIISQQLDVKNVPEISPKIQRDRIIDRSKKIWERLEHIDRFVEGCSRADAKKIHALFDQLAILFRRRLEEHESEPRAISFTISSLKREDERNIYPLLKIAQSAQLLYFRSGPAKERGKREIYYVPNRMLWPVRGLDPHGQHARVSIKASHIISAFNGEPIPIGEKSTSLKPQEHRGLFDDQE